MVIVPGSEAHYFYYDTWREWPFQDNQGVSATVPVGKTF